MPFNDDFYNQLMANLSSAGMLPQVGARIPGDAVRPAASPDDRSAAFLAPRGDIQNMASPTPGSVNSLGGAVGMMRPLAPPRYQDDLLQTMHSKLSDAGVMQDVGQKPEPADEQMITALNQGPAGMGGVNLPRSVQGAPPVPSGGLTIMQGGRMVEPSAQPPAAGALTSFAKPEDVGNFTKAFKDFQMSGAVPGVTLNDPMQPNASEDYFNRALRSFEKLQKGGVDVGNLGVQRAEAGTHQQLSETEARKAQISEAELRFRASNDAFLAKVGQDAYDKTLAATGDPAIARKAATDSVQAMRGLIPNSPIQIAPGRGIFAESVPAPGGQPPTPPTPTTPTQPPGPTPIGTEALPLAVQATPKAKAEDMLLKIHDLDNGATLAQNTPDILSFVRNKASDGPEAVDAILNGPSNVGMFKSGLRRIGLNVGGQRKEQIFSAIRNAVGQPQKIGLLDALIQEANTPSPYKR